MQKLSMLSGVLKIIRAWDLLSNGSRKQTIIISFARKSQDKCFYLQVEETDTAQYKAEVEMYGAQEELSLEYWKELAEKRQLF